MPTSIKDIRVNVYKKISREARKVGAKSCQISKPGGDLSSYTSPITVCKEGIYISI